jgi:hypothetical protein
MDDASFNDDLFKAHGERTGVPWQLIKAVVKLEFELNPQSEKTIHKEGTQASNLRKADGGRGVLFEPNRNIRMGVDILHWNLKLYGFLKGIATYNLWQESSSPAKGPFKNQNYVDMVISQFQQYGGDVNSTSIKYGEGSASTRK